MLRVLSRTLLLTAAGLVAGAVSVAAWYARSPGFAVDFERDLPPIVSGLYPVERAGPMSFAWTSGRTVISMAGADRRVPWTCRIRGRGARPPGVPPAEIAITADGVTLLRQPLGNDFEDMAIDVPERESADGLQLTIDVTPTFVPGPADSRALGAQATALECRATARPLPPRAALGAGAAAAAIIGAALGLLLTLPVAAATGATLVTALAAGFPLAWAAAPYSGYPGTAVRAAAAVAIVVVVGWWLAGRWRREPLGPAATAAVALSGVLLFLELLGLLHPSKNLIDAVFHAHRLEWVMGGRYLFTQPMPSGVRFPYAIALYVVALPWTLVAHDHVALLKIVVLAARALAGLLLFPVVVRACHDNKAAVLAVALFHAVPLPFLVIGYANLTYAFGQSAAVAAMACTVLIAVDRPGFGRALALWALCALAFLAHVGIFPLLFAVLLATAAGYAWIGEARLRPAARVVAASAILAAVFSVIVYYGHFSDAYRTLARVRAHTSAEASAPSRPAAAPAQVRELPLGDRVRSAAAIGVQAFGWPVLLLAAAGAWTWIRERWRDPLAIVLAATLGAAAMFVGGSVLAPIEPAFWRYTAEFISRVNYVAVPAVVILGARGAARGWAAGGWPRAASTAVVALAATGAVRAWLAWLL